MLRRRLNRNSYAIRTVREVGILVMDVAIVCLTFIISLILGEIYVLKADVDIDIWSGAIKAIAAIIVLYGLSFWAFRVFKVVWRYAKIKDYLRILGASVVAFTIFK